MLHENRISPAIMATLVQKQPVHFERPLSFIHFVHSIRGGSQAKTTAAPSIDADSIYIRSAVGYFNNLRVPAAVLASIIMKEMFVLQNTPPSSIRKWDIEHGIDKSKRWRSVRYAYLLLMVLAFSLESNTIFLATQVLTQLATMQMVMPTTSINADANNNNHMNRSNALHGQQSNVKNISEGESVWSLGMNTMRNGISGIGGGKKTKELMTAVSMVDFLLKNFEFEYASVRCNFVTGLLSFILAQALRVRYALRKHRELSISGMCCLLTVASSMLTYTNSNTISYGGYWNLLKRQFQLNAQFLLARSRSGPMSVVTAILSILTIVYALIGAFSPEFAYFGDEHNDDDDDDGSKRRRNQ